MSDSTNTAQTAVGHVSEVISGEAYARNPEGELRPLDVGSPLYISDNIEASNDSSIVIEMNSGQHLTIPDDLYDQFLANAIIEQMRETQAQQAILTEIRDEHSQGEFIDEDAIATLNSSDILSSNDDSVFTDQAHTFTSDSTISFDTVSALSSVSDSLFDDGTDIIPDIIF